LQEIDDIASVLGETCFANAQKMSVELSIQQVTTDITKISNINRIDKTQSDDLRELKDNLEKIQKDYATLSPYKKTIKLFEIYRMLNEGGLCK